MKTTSFFLRASMVAGLALAPLLMTSEVSAAPAQASCFDAKMTYLTDCGEAEIGANLAVKDDAIRITVTGDGAVGAGMPTVAEMVVSGRGLCELGYSERRRGVAVFVRSACQGP